ncbi:MAG: cation:proton antiporter [Clostridia bacterium]|nr:cation:proton antiporter [Clostridia bacterium]
MNAILGVALAMVFGLILNRIMKLFNLPNVTGYLIAGILVGPYCMNFLNENSIHDISFITTIALGFIAFSIGGEFKLETIKKLGGKVITITVLQAMLAVAFVMASLFVVQAIKPELVSTPVILILSAVATATAPAATLMVVRQYKAKGPVTDTLLPVVALDDAIGLIVFAICFGIAKVLAGGGELTAKTIALLPLLEIVLSLSIGTALGVVLAFLCKLFKSRANRLCCTVCVVLVAVGLCQIEILGVHMSSLLICMMIGAGFTNCRDDAIIILDGPERWTPPLFMLFFVISGAELNLSQIPYIGVIGIVYIAFRSLGKYLGAYLGGAVTKAEKPVRRYLGITLLPQAGVAIGMAQTVANEPALQSVASGIVTVVLCATLIYELVGPLLTKICLKAAGEIKEQGSLPIVEIVKGLSQKIKKKQAPAEDQQK